MQFRQVERKPPMTGARLGWTYAAALALLACLVAMVRADPGSAIVPADGPAAVQAG